MKRNILLLEPNYKNKYPPIGLMKLASYHREIGDNVTFYKGELKEFILEEIYKELLSKLIYNDNLIHWSLYKPKIIEYIKLGRKSDLFFLAELSDNPLIISHFEYYRKYYNKKKYFSNPKWDRVCITTLFTFHWKITIETIEFAKKICKNNAEVWVGGVMASVVPEEIRKETGINPHRGLLNEPRIMDKDNDLIIDEMPLDYSILDEIDYQYPENNAYYGYMTRGCINKCKFCAVPKIEPKYEPFISLNHKIEKAADLYGVKRNLLLLDNNVLASNRFDDIINEIKANGFTNESIYIEPNQLEIAIRNLINGINNQAYLKKSVKLFNELIKKLNGDTKQKIYNILSDNNLLCEYTATKEAVLNVYPLISELYESIRNKRPKKRYVDFNQGIDARLINEKNMKRLSEIPIRPLRIAFDSWSIKDKYENAIKLAARYGIRSLSNYLLYNETDHPIDLYNRLKLNIELCEKYKINIYSFPMKYHPISDPEYFQNRNYLGKHWNRKFIRAIQAVLNSTKGKIGKGKSFFEEAFGKNEEEFYKILYMPETFIIYRFHFKDNLTKEWWEIFSKLPVKKANQVKQIIEMNDFSKIESLTKDNDILNVLNFYKISRDDAEKTLKTNMIKEIK